MFQFKHCTCTKSGVYEHFKFCTFALFRTRFVFVVLSAYCNTCSLYISFIYVHFKHICIIVMNIFNNYSLQLSLRSAV